MPFGLNAFLNGVCDNYCCIYCKIYLNYRLFDIYCASNVILSPYYPDVRALFLGFRAAYFVAVAAFRLHSLGIY